MKLYIWLISGAVALLQITAASAQDRIPRQVMASGGAKASNSQFTLVGTIGQKAIGNSSTGNNAILAGFWQPFMGIPVEVEPDPVVLPHAFRLQQNFPNPFNPETKISYDLPAENQVLLTIYNMVGQKIRTLVNQDQAPGSYSLQWDGRDEAGRQVASGMFVYRISAGQYSASRKMLLLR